MGDVRLERRKNGEPLLLGLDLVEALDDSEEGRETLAFDTAQDQLADLINLFLGGQNENDVVGDSGGVQAGGKVALKGEVLELLLESVDGHAEWALRHLGLDIDAGVQALDGFGSVAVAAEGDNDNVSWGAIPSGEDGSLLEVLVVFLELELLVAVATVEFGHDLLMGGLADASLVAYLAYRSLRRSVSYVDDVEALERRQCVGVSEDTRCAELGRIEYGLGSNLGVSVPLAAFLREPLVAWRDLKGLLLVLVVGLCEWPPTAPGILLDSPPALNRKGSEFDARMVT